MTPKQDHSDETTRECKRLRELTYTNVEIEYYKEKESNS